MRDDKDTTAFTVLFHCYQMICCGGNQPINKKQQLRHGKRNRLVFSFLQKWESKQWQQWSLSFKKKSGWKNQKQRFPEHLFFYLPKYNLSILYSSSSEKVSALKY